MFEFQAKTRILFGVDKVKQLGEEVNALAAQKVLIVTDKGIVDAGVLEKVTQPLTEAGIDFAVHDEIEANPTDLTIIKGTECVKDEKADLIVSIGGGSPIDAAKCIAVMAVNEGTVEQYCHGEDPWPAAPLPTIAIPTMAGTGAEVSSAAMVTIKGLKLAFYGPSILPQLALLDPILSLDLPPRFTALTGVDALTHAVEAYVCAGANPISDALAERAITLVAENLRQAYANGQDIEARSNMLLASAMAIMAACNAGGLGIIHSLGQSIGGYYDLPHALTINICIPVGLEYNAIALPKKHAKIAELLGTNTSGLSPVAAAKTVVTAHQELIADLGTTDTLQSVGVQKKDFPKLAEICMLDASTPVNPRTIDAKGFEALYQQAYSNQ